jgi:hypothetical protein
VVPTALHYKLRAMWAEPSNGAVFRVDARLGARPKRPRLPTNLGKIREIEQNRVGERRQPLLTAYGGAVGIRLQSVCEQYATKVCYGICRKSPFGDEPRYTPRYVCSPWRR